MMDEFKIKIIKDNSNIIEKNAAIINNIKLIQSCFHSNAKKYLGELLGYYPLSDKKVKMFQKLNISQKRGYISRYIMGCASKSGIPDIYIKDFLTLKYRQNKKIYQLDSNENKIILRSKIRQGEMKLLMATLQLSRKISIRKRKLDEIFLK